MMHATSPPQTLAVEADQKVDSQQNTTNIYHIYDSALSRDVGEMIILRPSVSALLNKSAQITTRSEDSHEMAHPDLSPRRVEVLDLSHGSVSPGRYMSTYFPDVKFHLVEYENSELRSSGSHNTGSQCNTLHSEPSSQPSLSDINNAYDMLISICEGSDDCCRQHKTRDHLLQSARTILKPGGIVVFDIDTESFKADELFDLLTSFGLTMLPDSATRLPSLHAHTRRSTKPATTHYSLILAQKPILEINLTSKRQLPFKLHMHPNVSMQQSQTKGRHMIATAHIQAGTILTIEKAYAVIPWTRSSPYLMCNSPLCNRILPSSSPWLSCTNCINRVVWCTHQCRDQDHTRHTLECSWLHDHAATVLRNHGTHTFTLLWLTIRILVRRYLEVNNNDNDRTTHLDLESTFQDPTLGSPDWHDIWDLCDNHDLLSPDELAQWTQILTTYINTDQSPSPSPSSPSHLPPSLNLTHNLHILGKISQNAFALTSTRPLLTTPIPSGHNSSEQQQQQQQENKKDMYIYGTGLFYRSGLYNHSCSPNVSD